MEKLTEKQLEVLAREAAFADIKRDEENIVPLTLIKVKPEEIKIPKINLIRL